MNAIILPPIIIPRKEKLVLHNCPFIINFVVVVSVLRIILLIIIVYAYNHIIIVINIVIYKKGNVHHFYVKWVNLRLILRFKGDENVKFYKLNALNLFFCKKLIQCYFYLYFHSNLVLSLTLLRAILRNKINEIYIYSYSFLLL